MSHQEEKSELERDAAAARLVLQSEEGADLQAVHSSKSVTAMIKSSRDKLLGETISKAHNEVRGFYFASSLLFALFDSHVSSYLPCPMSLYILLTNPSSPLPPSCTHPSRRWWCMQTTRGLHWASRVQ